MSDFLRGCVSFVWFFAGCLLFSGCAGCRGGEESEFEKTIKSGEGGIVETEGGEASVEIPGEAVTRDVEISITVRSARNYPDSDMLGSDVYEFGPAGHVFDEEVTIRIMLDLDAPDGHKAIMVRLEDDAWAPKPSFNEEGTPIYAELKLHDSDPVKAGEAVLHRTMHFSAYAVMFVEAGDEELTPPVITVHPEDQTVAEGFSAMFSIEAAGIGTIEYQWQRSLDEGGGWMDIEGETGPEYTIEAVGEDDSGIWFRCIASNEAGSTESDAAVLRVEIEKPVITVHPVDQRVMEGGTAEFRVEARGSGILEYQWSRSNDAGLGWEEIDGAISNVYTISETNWEDDGSQFRCRVSNNAGSVDSDAALLVVEIRAPVIEEEPEDQSVMEGEEATFSIIASGSGTLLYQWQIRADENSDWENIENATDSSYTTQAVRLDNSGSQFRCRVSNEAGTVESGAATLTVEIEEPLIVEHPLSVTVTEGETAEFAVMATGSGTLVYQWSRSDDGGATWMEIAGETGPAYTTGATTLADDGAQFRCEVSNEGGIVISDAAILTVLEIPAPLPPTITQNPENITVEEGETATFSVAASGEGTLSYQWSRSDDEGATWINIGGANSPDYTTDPVEEEDNGARFRCTVSNEGGSVVSGSAVLTVETDGELEIIQHPEDRTVEVGEVAEFSVTAVGLELSYQWQRSDDGGASWIDIPGATESVYTTEAAEEEDNGARFRCVISNEDGSIESEYATLTVESPGLLEITHHPEDLTVTERESAQFSVTAVGLELSFQWQRSDDDGAGWADIDGAEGRIYQIGKTELSDNGAQFRCVVSNDDGSEISESALLTVEMGPPLIEEHPASKIVAAGETAEFSVTAIGSGTVEYQWMRSDDEGDTWVEIEGADESVYETPATTADDNDARFRCSVSNEVGSVESDAAILTVELGPPVITEHPSNVSRRVWQTATFSITAIGAGTLEYQWYRSNDEGVTWNELGGATGTSYTTPATVLADSGAQFRCVVTNEEGSAESNAATLTVREESQPPPPPPPPPEFKITAHPENKTVIEGETATFSVTATGPGLSYQWQRSNEGSTTWVNINEATSATYTTSATTLDDNGARFRCRVNSNGDSLNSNSALLTVNMAPPVITAGPEDQTVTEGETATFSVTATGSGTINYQWQIWDEDGSEWTDIAGATDFTWTTSETTIADDGAEFRCVVSNEGGSVESDPALLTVNMLPPVITAHPANQTVTVGETATFSVTTATSTGPLSYQWQKSDDVGSSWSDIDGAEADTYTTPETETEHSGRYYRCIVTNASGSVESDSALLIVEGAAPTITKHPSDQYVPSGQTAEFTVEAAGTGTITYQWERSDDEGTNWNEIGRATSSNYTTSQTIPDDDGAWFRCVVSNDDGASGGSVESDHAVLHIMEPPSITMQPQPSVVTEGQAATYSVTATGSGTITYQWQTWDGTEWTDIAGATDFTWTTPATTLDDDGAEFRCVVSNEAGSLESDSALLTVNMAPPVIAVHPEAQTVFERETATFSVTATGSGTIEYQWQRSDDDGTEWNNITGARSATYTTPETVFADNGALFRCEVSNEEGSVESDSALLNVNMAPPVITEPPVAQTVTEGQAATFSVTATGSGTIEYQWQIWDEDGEEWTDIDGAISETYTTGATEFDDNDTFFRCVVSNEAGNVESSSAVLKIDLLLPVITGHPEAQEVTEGETATFSVTATGSGTIEYQWQRSDDNGANWSEIDGATEAAFTTPETVFDDDEAQFRCVVSNEAGAVESDPALLTVELGPPVITKHPSNASITEGERATFSVTATGSGTIEYQWQRSDDEGGTWDDIERAIAYSYQTSITTLDDDGAEFRCVVTNETGSVESDPALLTVNMAPPVISLHPSDQIVLEGETATFIVEATGSGTLSYQWQRSDDDGDTWQDIDEANEDEYTISATNLDDNGARFQCKVSNAEDGGGDVFTEVATLIVFDGIWKVNANAGPDGDGLSWDTAFKDLQDALIMAANEIGHEIWVAAGTYKPTSEEDRTVSFEMVPGVAIYGGFAGDEENREDRKWVTNPTILSGDIGNVDDSSDNSYHVIRGADDAILDGFTITGGNADGEDWPYNSGGGMYNNDVNPIIVNCTFRDNKAVFGGGMYNEDSNPVVTNSIFHGNRAYTDGGGMYNRGSDSDEIAESVLTNCTFSGNEASGYGGALFNGLNSLPIITNTIIWGNISGHGGASIYNVDNDSAAVVSYSCIEGDYTGDNNINEDPLFVNADEGNYRLQAGSPAVDAGTNAPFEGDGIAVGADKDLDGNLREFNDQVDMGAYEQTLESIEVKPEEAGIVVGTTQLFEAWGTFADGSTEEGRIENVSAFAEWSSDDEVVAEMDGAVATGITEGSTDITASYMGITGTADLTVTESVLESIRIDPVSASIPLGTQKAFVAIGTFSNDSEQPVTDIVTWSSNNPSIATIGVSDGIAYAVGEGGPVTITASYNGVDDAVATLTVTEAVVAGLRIEPDWNTVRVEETAEYKAYAILTDGSEVDVTVHVDTVWSVENETIATVVDVGDNAGVVTGLFEGNTRVVADYNGEFTAYADVIVSGGLLQEIEIEITSEEESVPVGLNIQFTATGLFTNSTSEDLTDVVQWESDNEDVATIASLVGAGSGLLTGVGEGTADIHAVYDEDGEIFESNSIEVEVTAPVLVAVEIRPATAIVNVAEDIQFSAYGIYSDGNEEDYTADLAWSSEDDSVATVSDVPGSRGLALGVDIGDTIIIATHADTGIYGTAELNVTGLQLERIEITPENAVISVGMQQAFTATGFFEGDTSRTITNQVTWESSNPHAATIEQNGVADGIDFGTATISASLGDVSSDDGDGVSATLTVFDGIWKVDANAEPGGNGLSWITAFKDLQDALMTAVPGQEIWVAAGTYMPTAGADRTISFEMVSGVAIYGGFNGTENNREDRNWEVNETVLSGDIGNEGDPSDNSYNVIRGANDAILDGFTITGGNADGEGWPHYLGGGMLNENANPTVSNVVFDDNAAVSGGGMYNLESNPDLIGCTFSGNTAVRGGGMYNTGSNPEIMDTDFMDNEASEGGGMYNDGSAPDLIGCTFSGNTAVRGGGMYNTGSNPEIMNTDFMDNEASDGNSGGEGGGMYNLGSAPDLIGCTFSGNTAVEGGGMHNDDSNPALTNSVFINNEAVQGGGMYNIDSNPNIINNLFVGNEADHGGGLLNIESHSLVTNCTFSGNTATGFGGGILNVESNPIITNTILWGNLANEGKSVYNYVDDDFEVSVPLITYSCIEGGYAGEGNIATDPLFVNAGEGNYRLQAGSPAVDAGTNKPFLPDGIAEDVDTDLDGNTRIVNDIVDMGAYELQQ